MKNTLTDKSGNTEYIKKIIATVQKLFNQCVHGCQGFAEGTLWINLFTVLRFKWSVKIHCVAKILLAIWQTFLHEDNRH